MKKQFTPDLKLKAVNYYHKINNYKFVKKKNNIFFLIFFRRTF